MWIYMSIESVELVEAQLQEGKQSLCLLLTIATLLFSCANTSKVCRKLFLLLSSRSLRELRRSQQPNDLLVWATWIKPKQNWGANMMRTLDIIRKKRKKQKGRSYRSILATIKQSLMSPQTPTQPQPLARLLVLQRVSLRSLGLCPEEVGQMRYLCRAMEVPMMSGTVAKWPLKALSRRSKQGGKRRVGERSREAEATAEVEVEVEAEVITEAEASKVTVIEEVKVEVEVTKNEVTTEAEVEVIIVNTSIAGDTIVVVIVVVIIEDTINSFVSLEKLLLLL